MSFMEAYKRLDQLCGQVLNNSRGISAYIEEMTRLSSSAWRIRGWDHDLEKLKHYRWVRNQIAHATNCNEENMCDEEDACWLEDFHRRIMVQQDPLTLCRKAMQATPKPKSPKPPVKPRESQHAPVMPTNKPGSVHEESMTKRIPNKKSHEDVTLKWCLVALFVLFAVIMTLLIRSL